MKEGGQRLGARSEMDQSLVFSLVSCTGSLGALVSFVLLLVLHFLSDHSVFLTISLAICHSKAETLFPRGLGLLF